MPPPDAITPATHPRLLCDGTLGALCRWLRAAGYDTVFVGPGPRRRRDRPALADELVARARAESRLLLTRSARIATAMGEGALLVKDDHPFHQVLEVSRVLQLSLVDHALTRCREDNTPLVHVPADAVQERIPPYVAATQHQFRECTGCHRVYWGATHRDSMLERLAQMEQLRTSEAVTTA